MPRLTNLQRISCCTLAEEGYSNRELARRFAVSPTTISSLLTKFRNTNSVEDLPHRRRPRISTPAEDRLLVRRSLRNRFANAVNLRNQWREIGVQSSVTTVKRRLKVAGLKGRVAKRKNILTNRQKANRLQFAREHVTWTRNQWNRVIFTDEAPFHIHSCARRRYVRRRSNEPYDATLTIPPSKRQNAKITIWGSISVRGVGTLQRFRANVDQHSYLQVLNEVIPPMHLPQNAIWQQDNAPAHSSRLVQQFFRDRRISVMQWPPFSPDLNPIENVWSLLHERLDLTRVTTADQLWRVVQQGWNSLTPMDIRPFINSMTDRCRAVIESRGAPTKY